MNILIKKILLENRRKNLAIILAIAISVALLTGVTVMVDSVKNQYHALANEQSSSADLLITTTAEVLVNSQSLVIPEFIGMDTVFNYFSTDAYMEKENGAYVPLRLLAVDFKAEQEWKGLTMYDGALPSVGECVITEMMMNQYGLHIGSNLTIMGTTGTRTLTITGIAADRGICTENLSRCVLIGLDGYSGYGNLTYKIILNKSVDVRNAKDELVNSLGSGYRVAFPDGKADEFLESSNILFMGMMGFGVLAFLLCCYFLNMVMKNHVWLLRRTFAITKSYGATRVDIIRLVFSQIMILSGIGIIIGVILGLFGSASITELMKNMLELENISLVFSVSKLLGIVITCIVVILISCIPVSIRSANESIVSGLMEQSSTNMKKSIKSIAIPIILLSIFIVIYLFAQSQTLRAIVMLGICFLAIKVLCTVLFSFFVKLCSVIFSSFSPKNGLMVTALNRRNNKAIILITLFTMAISFSYGILLTAMEFSDSFTNIAEEYYVGNAVVYSDMSIGEDFISAVSNIEHVQSTVLQCQKNVDIDDVEVKVRGINLPLIDQKTLYGIPVDEMEILQQPNTILISQSTLNRIGLSVGDSLALNTTNGEASYQIAGTFTTMEHNGHVALMSSEAFTNLFKDYTTNTLLIYSDGVIDDSVFINSLINTINDNRYIVQSIEQSREEYVQQNNGFISLIYCIVVIFLGASAVIIYSSIATMIRDNLYTNSIQKALGYKKSSIVFQYILSGFMYSAISAILGILFGIIINKSFVSLLNSTDSYNLVERFDTSLTVLIIILAITIVLIATIISIGINYRQRFNKSLVH